MSSIMLRFGVLFCVFLCTKAMPAKNVDSLDFEKDHPCGVEASSNPIHLNPWNVFLEYYMDGQRKMTRCGGTLIGKRHVVTAAHCVKTGLFTRLVARLGDYDLAKEIDCVDGVCGNLPVKINVVDVKVHPNYNGKEDDIAVLTLEKDADYTEFIRAVCLPTKPPANNVIFTASGFGELISSSQYSTIKKNIHLPGWSNEKCKAAYKKSHLAKKILCAGGEAGIDTCRGDSGGPLVVKEDRIVLHGVTSAGNIHCGTKGFPGIYTSVYHHMDFIQQNILEGSVKT